METNAAERRFDPNRQHVLTGADRWEKWQPPRLLGGLGIKPGQSVLDLGCGPGFWTLPLAAIVSPTGVVWALDVSQALLDALAARQPPPHVRLLRSELPAINLPDAAADWVWGAFVVHEVEPPAELMHEIRHVLRPGGRVALLDWRPDASPGDGPPIHHRLAPELVIEHLHAGGFPHASQTWQNADGYLVEAQ